MATGRKKKSEGTSTSGSTRRKAGNGASARRKAGGDGSARRKAGNGANARRKAGGDGRTRRKAGGDGSSTSVKRSKKKPEATVAKKSAQPRPTAIDIHELTATRAYFLWEASGRLPGREVENWLEAERQITEETRSPG